MSERLVKRAKSLQSLIEDPPTREAVRSLEERVTLLETILSRQRYAVSEPCALTTRSAGVDPFEFIVELEVRYRSYGNPILISLKQKSQQDPNTLALTMSTTNVPNPSMKCQFFRNGVMMTNSLFLVRFAAAAVDTRTITVPPTFFQQIDDEVPPGESTYTVKFGVTDIGNLAATIQNVQLVVVELGV